MVWNTIRFTVENVDTETVHCTDYIYDVVPICKRVNLLILLWSVKNTLNYRQFQCTVWDL